MRVYTRVVSFNLPIFLVCFWGHEFRGISLPTVTISIAIAVSMMLVPTIRKLAFSSRSIFIAIGFALYACICVFVDRGPEENFSYLNLVEDLYALFVFAFFYLLGKLYEESSPSMKKSVTNSIAIGVVMNALVCFAYLGSSWLGVYFQRLWNPYFLALVPFLSFALRQRRYSIFTILFPILFIASFSLQMLLAGLLILIILLLPVERILLFNRRVLGLVIICSAAAMLTFSLTADPFIVSQLDHNAAVRLIFWRDAMAYALAHPAGLGLGVSVVTGDMSLMGETAFHGRGEFSDMGVHSGVMSVIYRFGVFAPVVLYLMMGSALLGRSVSAGRKKEYLLLTSVAGVSMLVNDAVMAPHFSAGVGFVFGLLSSLGTSGGVYDRFESKSIGNQARYRL